MSTPTSTSPSSFMDWVQSAAASCSSVWICSDDRPSISTTLFTNNKHHLLELLALPLNMPLVPRKKPNKAEPEALGSDVLSNPAIILWPAGFGVRRTQYLSASVTTIGCRLSHAISSTMGCCEVAGRHQRVLSRNCGDITGRSDAAPSTSGSAGGATPLLLQVKSWPVSC